MIQQWKWSDKLRPSLLSSELTRPDWTLPQCRLESSLWLDKNENADPVLREEIRQFLLEIPSRQLSSYPDTYSLYQSLAKHLGLSASQLLLTAGSDGAIRTVFEALIAPGDLVVDVEPTFAMYSVYAKIYGARRLVVEYERASEGPILDLDKLKSFIQKHLPKLVCLPNPGSPTGSVVEVARLNDLIEFCRLHGVFILIDEAYYPFYPHTVLPWLEQFENLIVTRTTAKAWGMAGFRIGFLAASSSLVAYFHKLKPMYEANTIGVCLFEKMLQYYDLVLKSVERLEEGKKYFLKQMDKLGFDTFNGYGNFLHVCFGKDELPIHQILAGKVLYRKNFSENCLKGFSRFSSTTQPAFEGIVELIKKQLLCEKEHYACR